MSVDIKTSHTVTMSSYMCVTHMCNWFAHIHSCVPLPPCHHSCGSPPLLDQPLLLYYLLFWDSMSLSKEVKGYLWERGNLTNEYATEENGFPS